MFEEWIRAWRRGKGSGWDVWGRVDALARRRRHGSGLPHGGMRNGGWEREREEEIIGGEGRGERGV